MNAFKFGLMIDTYVNQSEEVKKLRINTSNGSLLAKEELSLQLYAKDICSVLTSVIGGPIWYSLSFKQRQQAEEIWNTSQRKNHQELLLLANT